MVFGEIKPKPENIHDVVENTTKDLIRDLGYDIRDKGKHVLIIIH